MLSAANRGREGRHFNATIDDALGFAGDESAGHADASRRASLREVSSSMERDDRPSPAAIAVCANPADVAATLRFAAEAGLNVTVLGGGHSVGGLPMTGSQHTA